VTRPQSPIQITALGIIALLPSKERHARQHHEPARAPEKSIEPAHVPPFRPRSVQPSFCVGCAPQKLLFRSLTLASLNPAWRDLAPPFPQRSPPSLLTTAACGGLRSTPDCRPRRVLLHLSYSYAPSYSDGTRDTRPGTDMYCILRYVLIKLLALACGAPNNGRAE
jgi:hypothetical protein